MPLSTSQYGFIIDPMVPFTDASGTTIRNGYVRVFVAGSSTPVITYKNYDGATNEETIQLDNSGRTAYPVIVSKGNTYKVCVYDAEHSQESPILTIDKVVPAGANVEATNIVTGLDNVESPEAGWVKSTVSGTDAEVSLDATNVTSEVDTMAKATAASADYMMPLVHKTGSAPDKKITLGNIFKFVLNFIHSLTDTATEADLASGNYFALDGSAGTKKLNSTTLLTKTAQNALAGNVAPAFVPNSTDAVAGKLYMYQGTLYKAKVDYNGVWNASKFEQASIDSEFLHKEEDEVIVNGILGKRAYNSVLKGGSTYVDINIFAPAYASIELELDSTTWDTTSVASDSTIIFIVNYKLKNGSTRLIEQYKKSDTIPKKFLLPIPSDSVGLVVNVRGDVGTDFKIFAGALHGEKVENLRSILEYNSFELLGKDNVAASLDIPLIPGNNYKFKLPTTSWDRSGVTLTGSWYDLRVSTYNAIGTENNLYIHYVTDAIFRSELSFVAPDDAVFCRISIRATTGEKVSFFFGNSLNFERVHNESLVMSYAPLFELVGKGTSSFSNGYSKLIPNVKYFLTISDFTPSPTLSSSSVDLQVYISTEPNGAGTKKYVINHIISDGIIKQPLVVETTDSMPYLTVAIRAALNELVYVKLGFDVSARLDDKTVDNETMYTVINATGNGKYFSCLAVGDPHNQSIPEIAAGKVVKEYPIDCAICVGDITYSMFSNDETDISDFYKRLGRTKPVYCVAGNHDAGQTSFPGEASTHSQMYDQLIKPMVDNGWLTVGEYEVGKPYWLHDISDKKIRLIGVYEFDAPLDCVSDGAWRPVTYDSSKPQIALSTSYTVGDIVNCGTFDAYSFECVSGCTTPSNWSNGTSANTPQFKIPRYSRVIRQTQAQWFVDALLGTPADYSVIVVLHSAFSWTSTNQKEYKFANPALDAGDCLGYTTMRNSQLIASAIQAFINGESFSMNVAFSGSAEYLNTEGGGAYSYSVSADFTAKNSGVKFGCIISGHSHNDLILRDESFDGILDVSVTSLYDTGRNDDILFNPKLGYANRNTMVSLNTDTDSVNLVKIGAKVTTRMTPRDYENIPISSN